MHHSNMGSVLILLCTFTLVSAGAAGVCAQQAPVAFSEELWTYRNANTLEHDGRACLQGMAYLTGVEFTNGVIEVDVIFPHDNTRSYPGLIFRIQSDRNYERFYLRPHRGGLYPDALQYTPVINGVAGWQLYSGDGYTAGADIPTGEWIHLTLEVKDTQARIFLGDDTAPSLVIDNLEHGISAGTIGLHGPRDGTAYFSNFSYRIDDSLAFIPAPAVETPPGTLTEWELSKPFAYSDVPLDTYPAGTLLASADWQDIACARSGLVDIARHRQRTGGVECVLARTTIHAERERIMELQYGYSDLVSVFLNGNLLYTGASAYRQRDPSFLGIVGLFDALYLPLAAGDNELLLIVAESFGGWGFICREGDVTYEGAGVRLQWETDEVFLCPETAAFNPADNRLYVSNYDIYGAANPLDRQYISRLNLDGSVETEQWVTGLNRPTGMVVMGELLYVLERRSLTAVDLASGAIRERHDLPQARFLNDIAAASDGSLYISDSSAHTLYRFTGGTFEPWLTDDAIQNPNGLHIHGNTLLVGANGDHCLKAVDLTTKKITTIVRMPHDIIDGIETDTDGNYLVSQTGGKLYRITPAGGMTKLIDTTGSNRGAANFAYIEDGNMVVIPTFTDNRLVAYRLTR